MTPGPWRLPLHPYYLLPRSVKCPPCGGAGAAPELVWIGPFEIHETGRIVSCPTCGGTGQYDLAAPSARTT